jgi:hypothetical protein
VIVDKPAEPALSKDTSVEPTGDWSRVFDSDESSAARRKIGPTAEAAKATTATPRRARPLLRRQRKARQRIRNHIPR